jgi:hypothetical protein
VLSKKRQTAISYHLLLASTNGGEKEKLEPSPALPHPMALVRLENRAPVPLVWNNR